MNKEVEEKLKPLHLGENLASTTYEAFRKPSQNITAAVDGTSIKTKLTHEGLQFTVHYPSLQSKKIHEALNKKMGSLEQEIKPGLITFINEEIGAFLESNESSPVSTRAVNKFIKIMNERIDANSTQSIMDEFQFKTIMV